MALKFFDLFSEPTLIKGVYLHLRSFLPLRPDTLEHPSGCSFSLGLLIFPLIIDNLAVIGERTRSDQGDLALELGYIQKRHADG